MSERADRIAALEREPVVDVLCEVLAERVRQDAKWGEQNHDNTVWLTVLTEEVGEASKAILDMRAGRDSNLREEVIHIAAVAVQWIEYLDRERQEGREG